MGVHQTAVKVIIVKEKQNKTKDYKNYNTPNQQVNIQGVPEKNTLHFYYLQFEVFIKYLCKFY